MNTEQKNNQVFINFENINLNDVQEIEEVVTAAFGTIACCEKS